MAGTYRPPERVSIPVRAPGSSGQRPRGPLPPQDPLASLENLRLIVIPAKAGIHVDEGVGRTMDSRVRGNDGHWLSVR